MALDTRGQARWYYEPAAGPSASPAALTAIIAYLLGAPARHGQPGPLPCPAAERAGRPVPARPGTVRRPADQRRPGIVRGHHRHRHHQPRPAPARHHHPLRRRRPRLALRPGGRLRRQPRGPHRHHHPDPAPPLTGAHSRQVQQRGLPAQRVPPSRRIAAPAISHFSRDRTAPARTPVPRSGTGPLAPHPITGARSRPAASAPPGSRSALPVQRRRDTGLAEVHSGMGTGNRPIRLQQQPCLLHVLARPAGTRR